MKIFIDKNFINENKQNGAHVFELHLPNGKCTQVSSSFRTLSSEMLACS